MPPKINLDERFWLFADAMSLANMHGQYCTVAQTADVIASFG
jgi:hypothetical protein